jgi:hypothetical protein
MNGGICFEKNKESICFCPPGTFKLILMKNLKKIFLIKIIVKGMLV